MSMNETCKEGEIALIESLPIKKSFSFHFGLCFCPFKYKGVFCYPSFNAYLSCWDSLSAVSSKMFIFLYSYPVLPTEEQFKFRESRVKRSRVTDVRCKKDICQKNEIAHIAPSPIIAAKWAKESKF
jgi:hypothetical protein